MYTVYAGYYTHLCEQVKAQLVPHLKEFCAEWRAALDYVPRAWQDCLAHDCDLLLHLWSAAAVEDMSWHSLQV